MDGMWKSLPDDCVSNIMSYWSPLNAHELKVFLYLNKILTELNDLSRNIVWGEKHKHIEYKQFKRYINLWTMIVKEKEVRQSYGSITTIKVKLTKNKLIISKLHETLTYQGEITRHYFVDKDDTDYRLVAKKYKPQEDWDFKQDAWHRNDISKKMDKQNETHNVFMSEVVYYLKDAIFNYMFNGHCVYNDDKRYLYKYI